VFAAVLQVHADFEFVSGLCRLSGRSVGLAEQVVRDEVGWVHLRGPVKVMQRLDGLLELE
jgi:hypothetical protein